MMISYIDDLYLIHFFKTFSNSERFSEEADTLAEIFDFFKSKSDIKLETDLKQVINELDNKTAQLATVLINKFTTGRNNTKISSHCQNEFRNLKRVDVYSKLKHPFSSFWLGREYNHSAEKYELNNPYFFITPENDLLKWKTISKQRIFYVQHYAVGKEEEILTHWEQLFEYKHSFRDILISDRYCLKDNVAFKENIIPLLKTILKPGSVGINISFFIKPGEALYSSVDELYSFVEQSLHEHDIRFSNISIILSRKTPHDRYIMTNNFIFESGDSFSYFEKNNIHKTSGTKLTIRPIFKFEPNVLQNLIYKWQHISLTTDENNKYYKKPLGLISSTELKN
ncbi:hypothetical protein FNB79_15445 [Formosa sediminum]|uniref:Uncharacterized protein n=1 Tax=Formosa sediminum TaxID=2594004 RepID=A0A516GUY9_9FLAO|nr:hypothetical protein [Formosa sediminum]QDO95305.1 hypothetical protein FNB79_15445 [Formosa sediminum]